jgi:subtilisin family serine protease
MEGDPVATHVTPTRPRTPWIAALAILALTASNVSGAPPLSAGADGSNRIDLTPAIAAKLAPRVTAAEGPLAVFVQLAAPSAGTAFDAARGRGHAAAVKAAKAAKAAVNGQAQAVLTALRSKDATVEQLYRTTNAVGGLAVIADADGIRAIAARDDVVAVSAIVPKRFQNASAVVLTRTLNEWQSLGMLGDDIDVGIIDTGIDYSHANFAGPGTPEAYDAIDPTDATGVFPTAKVVGGTDFVGDDYNASSDDPAANTPDPDDNPLDCNGHGSHVAGTAAGFGVNADGSTFSGDYPALTATDLDDMRIGPGTAPKANLFALKVFGCAGSTSVVGAALDWVLDPNDDGDFGDHLDVVNLSLGTDYATFDDPEAGIAREVMSRGVLTVFSAGNGGDLYDIGHGAPEALSVASTRDAFELLDAAEVTSPAEIAGRYAGQYSVAFDYDGVDITDDVVALTQADNLDGCAPFNGADAAQVAGRFVWLEWDDNDASRRCGSAARSANAVAAGATGAIFTSGLDHFSAGIAGSALIPVFQLNRAGTDTLRPALEAGTLVVRLAGDLRQQFELIDPALTDSPSSFTSRGARTPGVKPDVAAPGDTIVSTGVGTGNRPGLNSGTSMAAPHVAGIAALVRQANPSWTPAEVKAAIMGTANHDVYAGLGQTGPLAAPNRVGSGRVDGFDAVSTRVLAFDRSAPGVVSVGFGVVEVTAGSLNVDRFIRVVNKGGTRVTYSVAYDPITELPGVAFELDKTTISLNPGASTDVRVRLRIPDRNALRKVADPTIAKDHLDLPRQFLADASGRVLFTATSGTSVNLRVAVYAAPKPTAAINLPGQLKISGSGTTFMGLSGRGLDQGSGDEAYTSLYSTMELLASSPQLPFCTAGQTTDCALNQTGRSGDLRYVGAASTAPQGGGAGSVLGIGIATWGNWNNIGNHTIPFVDIDSTGDDIPDYEMFVTKLVDTDLLVVATVDLNSGEVVYLDFANGLGGDVDANVFDTNVIVLPVALGALGIDPTTETSHRIKLFVGVAGFYLPAGEDLVDSIPTILTFDPLKPGLWAEGASPSLIYEAQPGEGVVIHKDAAALAQDGSDSILVLNFHNATGDKARVIKIKN